MKLEKILLNGIEYYQWVILGFPNTVGDLFSNWRDIKKEKDKLERSKNG